MIEEFEKLAAAGHLVQMDKEAAVGDAISGALKAVRGVGREAYKTIGSATGGVAKSLKPYGLKGHIAGGAVRLAPWMIGAGLANEALGNPAGKLTRAKLQEFRAKRMQHRAVYDPRTGRFY